MKKWILFSFLILSLSVSAQVNYFVELSGNLSLIPSSEKTFFSDISINDAHQEGWKGEGDKASYNNRMESDITVGLNYFVVPKVSLETGLNFNLLRFKQTLDKKLCLLSIATNYRFLLPKKVLRKNGVNLACFI